MRRYRPFRARPFRRFFIRKLLNSSIDVAFDAEGFTIRLDWT